MLTYIERSISDFKILSNTTSGICIGGIGEDKKRYYIEFKIVDEKTNKVLVSAYKFKVDEVIYFNKGEAVNIDNNFQKLLKLEFDNFTKVK